MQRRTHMQVTVTVILIRAANHLFMQVQWNKYLALQQFCNKIRKCLGLVLWLHSE